MPIPEPDYHQGPSASWNPPKRPFERFRCAAVSAQVQGAARLAEDAPPADLLATPEDLGLADEMAAKLQARSCRTCSMCVHT